MITLPDAIKRIFGINVASDSQLLKNKANSFVRNGLLKTVKDDGVQRGKVYLADDSQFTPLSNALILNAFFTDPKHVKEVFDCSEKRTQCFLPDQPKQWFR